MPFSNLITDWLEAQRNAEEILEENLFPNHPGLHKKVRRKLKRVLRWERFVKNNPRIRKQNVYEHTAGMRLIGIKIIYHVLRHNPGLDYELLLSAFLHHDIGETYLAPEKGHGYDTLVTKKKEDGELQEFFEFRDWISNLPRFDRFQAERAFMLQHALKVPSSLPPDAKRVALALGKYKPLEARLFATAEWVEYLLYAVEQFTNHGERTVLSQVSSRYFKRICEASKEIPGFDSFWTPKHQEYILNVHQKV